MFICTYAYVGIFITWYGSLECLGFEVFQLKYSSCSFNLSGHWLVSPDTGFSAKDVHWLQAPLARSFKSMSIIVNNLNNQVIFIIITVIFSIINVFLQDNNVFFRIINVIFRIMIAFFRISIGIFSIIIIIFRIITVNFRIIIGR